jgi:Holliday junction resolvasome RuvABC endonuclease subunit
MSSPGFAVQVDDHIHLHGISSKKKDLGQHQISDLITIDVQPIPAYSNNSERFAWLASHYTELIQHYNGTQVHLEGYAMGAGRAGMNFTIGECTGYLKAELWRSGVTVNIIAPTALKKFATGKGNANKDAMMLAFAEKHQIETLPKLSCMNDCVDAYWLRDYDGDFYEVLGR